MSYSALDVSTESIMTAKSFVNFFLKSRVAGAWSGIETSRKLALDSAVFPTHPGKSRIGSTGADAGAEPDACDAFVANWRGRSVKKVAQIIRMMISTLPPAPIDA